MVHFYNSVNQTQAHDIFYQQSQLFTVALECNIGTVEPTLNITIESKN